MQITSDLLFKVSLGKGVPKAAISTPKNMKQHIRPTEKDITAEKDRPPYLVRVELAPNYIPGIMNKNKYDN